MSSRYTMPIRSDKVGSRCSSKAACDGRMGQSLLPMSRSFLYSRAWQYFSPHVLLFYLQLPVSFFSPPISSFNNCTQVDSLK